MPYTQIKPCIFLAPEATLTIAIGWKLLATGAVFDTVRAIGRSATGKIALVIRENILNDSLDDNTYIRGGPASHHPRRSSTAPPPTMAGAGRQHARTPHTHTPHNNTNDPPTNCEFNIEPAVFSPHRFHGFRICEVQSRTIVL